ncbi:MAG TPA: glycosyl transferase, partial [Variovorax sp.]|nr:glycosyl transferase [Variovorax sp.]
MIALIVISFVVSAFAVLVFMRRARRHARRYAADMPQRFHKGHVPRLGGAGIFVGTGAAWLAAGLFGDPFNVGWRASASSLVLLCMAPAVVGGIAEDVTQRVQVRWRLALTLGSALLLCWLLGLGVHRTGLGIVDAGMRAMPFAG